MKTFSLKKYLYPLITIFILLISWSVFSAIKNETFLYPSIITVLKSFISLFNQNNIIIMLSTFVRIVLSACITFIISLIIGYIYSWRKESYYFIKPVMNLMKSTPVIIISIFLFLLFNSSVSPFIITMLVTMPITTQSILTSIDSIDPSIQDDIKMNNVHQLKAWFIVYMPLIKKHLLMSFFQTFGLGLKVMIMGEYICYTKNSIGQELSQIKSSFEIGNLLAWGILIVLIVTISEKLINYIVKEK